jgi:hypothetical protein
MRRVVLAAAACLASACSSQERPERVASRAQAIQYGELDAESRFAVGICRTTSEPGRCIGICSGALILPNVVATARHCVQESVARVDCREAPRFAHRKQGSLFVTTRMSMRDLPASSWRVVKAVHTPEDDQVCGNDIALLELDVPIPRSEASPVTPGVQYVMWDRARYEDTFTAIGYGTTSPEGDGSGVRRKLDLVSVLCIPGSPDLPCPHGFNENEFAGGDGTCAGDSGSSAFERGSFERGEPVSFGVLSRGSVSEDETQCVSSVYTRFDAHRDFVVDVAERASDGYRLYPKPAWAAPRARPIAALPDAGGVAEEPVCTENKPCPSGYECRDNTCVPGPVAATPTSRETRGCSAAAGMTENPAKGALFVAFVALCCRRRRRS